MKLYHGTSEKDLENIRKYGILVSECDLIGDFGQGFYTTPSLQFAKQCAERRAFPDGKPVVLLFKTVSSRLLRKHHAEFLSSFYWKPLFWSDSYFIGAVSDVTDEIVSVYIQNQGKKKKNAANPA